MCIIKYEYKYMVCLVNNNDWDESGQCAEQGTDERSNESTSWYSSYHDCSNIDSGFIVLVSR